MKWNKIKERKINERNAHFWFAESFFFFCSVLISWSENKIPSFTPYFIESLNVFLQIVWTLLLLARAKKGAALSFRWIPWMSQLKCRTSSQSKTLFLLDSLRLTGLHRTETWYWMFVRNEIRKPRLIRRPRCIRRCN